MRDRSLKMSEAGDNGWQVTSAKRRERHLQDRKKNRKKSPTNIFRKVISEFL